MRLTILTLLLITTTQLAFARTIRVGTTISMPPYLYEESFTGIEVELIKEAFLSQIDVEFKHVDSSYKRAVKLLENQDIEVIVSNKNNKFYQSFKSHHISNIFLHYIDCIITLKEKGLKVNSVKDLSEKRVWAFKSAKRTLGDEYARAVEKSIQYTESSDQLLQAEALIKNRIDVAISDRNIFLSQAIKEGIYKDKFSFFKLTSKTPRVLRFKDKKLRDIFNKGLKEIKRNGKYQKILRKYKELYSSTCN